MYGDSEEIEGKTKRKQVADLGVLEGVKKGQSGNRLPICSNPFVTPEFKITVKRVDGKPVFGKSDEEGGFYIEALLFTKQFRPSWLSDVMLRISPQANKLYNHINLNISRGVDYITIDKKYYLETAEISDRTFRDSVVELIKSKVIKKYEGYRGRYWVNPALIYCGSRMYKFKNNIDDVTKKRKG